MAWLLWAGLLAAEPAVKMVQDGDVLRLLVCTSHHLPGRLSPAGLDAAKLIPALSARLARCGVAGSHPRGARSSLETL